MRRFGLFVGLALFSGFVLIGALRSEGLARSRVVSATPAPVQHVVKVAAVERGPLAHPIIASGVLRAKDELDLGFLVGGQIVWVGAEVGSLVHRGQPLARIDAAQIRADVDKARAAAVKARRDLNRVSVLESTGALPQATLDDAKTGDAVADAQQRAAEFALRHGVLTAPDDGIIDARMIDVGEMVGPGQPAFRLSGRQRGIVVRVYLCDRDVIGLEVGRDAWVTLDAAPDLRMPARVSQVATAASPASGTFEVELRLSPAPKQFKSGMTAKVAIDRVEQVGAVVPVSALVPSESNGVSVVGVTNDHAHQIPVKVLFFQDMQVALADSLPGIAQVATAGAIAVSDGSAVKVVAP